MNQMVEVWGGECFSGRGNNVHTSRKVRSGYGQTTEQKTVYSVGEKALGSCMENDEVELGLSVRC